MPSHTLATCMIVIGSCVAGSSVLAAGAPSAPPAFLAVASADGIRTWVIADGAPVTDNPYDGGSPVAQALFEPVGEASAFGSVLYPGDAIVSAPGLVAGFTQGQAPPIPDYPVIARADRLQPESSAEVPGSTMRANVGDDSAAAVATIGADEASGSRAEAAAGIDDQGRPFAVGEASVSGFETSGVALGSIRSAASVVLAQDGSLERTSSFQVAPFDVGGIRVAVGPDGFELAGTALPLEDAGLADLLDDALAPAGVEIDFLPQEELDNGVVSAGLRITSTVQLDAAVTEVRVVQSFGQVVATLAESVPVPTSEVSSGGVGPTPPAHDDQGIDNVASPAASRPAAMGTNTPAVAQTALVGLFDLRTFYLVLVGVALVAAGAGHLIRQHAVRLRWN